MTNKESPHRSRECIHTIVTHFIALSVIYGIQSCIHQRMTYLCFLLVYLFLPRSSDAQNPSRTFPSLFNLAKDQEVSTLPANSDCGVPSRTAFCQSSVDLTCPVLDICEQQCPRRVVTPHPLDLLHNAVGYTDCVATTTRLLQPYSDPTNSFAVNFTSGLNCFLIPSGVPSFGGNGAMTLTMWLYLNSSVGGTVFDKYGQDEELIVQVRVTPGFVQFMCRTILGGNVLNFMQMIPQLSWTFLALQVHGGTVSIFVNGIGENYAATDTQPIDGIIQDGAGFVRLGQDHTGNDQFEGLLQDVHFYSETLTNREIQEVMDGVLPAVDIQSECRCPSTHPRVRSTDTRFCIRNGVPDNTGDQTLRLNVQAHPLQYLVDGDAHSFWISSFLEDVWIEIDLGDQFEVFHVVVEFYSPQPKAMEIQHKISPADPWLTWQYYAENCPSAYNMPNNDPLEFANSVNCIQFSTITNPVPYTQGNVTLSLLSVAPVARPNIDQYYTSDLLLEFVQACKVRINMKEHYYVTNPRHRYFGVYEIVVDGRCNCSGHADYCAIAERPYHCICNEDSHTKGIKCEECQPLYNDKPFARGTRDAEHGCKPCECHNHADACYYDRDMDPYPDSRQLGGGGVCIDCRDNTTGQRCEMCAELFYSDFANMSLPSPCQPCECFEPGVQLDASLDCDRVSGQCSCKDFTEERQCNSCQPGYFNLQASDPLGCEPCGCNTTGTVDQDIACHATTGQCYCKLNVRGFKCKDCEYGFWDMTLSNPEGCRSCDCDPFGSIDQYCDPVTGQCYCKEKRIGQKCDRCDVGYYDFSSGCLPCACNSQGTEPGENCKPENGTCECKKFVAGDLCDRCKIGYHRFGADDEVGCLACGCDTFGTVDEDEQCDQVTGICYCRENVQGARCDECKIGHTNLTSGDPAGCVHCGCDTSGTVGSLEVDIITTCDQVTGACDCLTHRHGQRCDECDVGYFLQEGVEAGCSPCDCNILGTINGVPCDSVTGQCRCRDGYGNLQCSECLLTFYMASPASECLPCDCDLSGSTDNNCAVDGGQCQCKQNTQGRTCSQCIPNTSILDALNSRGCSGVPSQQPPPIGEVLGTDRIKLTWFPPDNPNGVIEWYKLYEDNRLLEQVTPPDELTYTHKRLVPFTEYRYAVESGNAVGSTMSPDVTYRTFADSPQGSIFLNFEEVGSRSATFSWKKPSSANGIIEKYILNSTSNTAPLVPVMHYSGLSLEVTLTDLIPYTYYAFRVYACTGPDMCLGSNYENITTLQALPEEQAPPYLTPDGPTLIDIEWDPPALPNGVITAYELWIRGTSLDENGMNDPPEQRIFYDVGVYDPLLSVTGAGAYDEEGDPIPEPETAMTARSLLPNTEYEFQVVTTNLIGKVASVWISATTFEAEPDFMPTPTIYTVNSTYVNITWRLPTNQEANGQILYFNVYRKQLSSATYQLVAGTLPPDSTFHVSGPYIPDVEETFRVEYCNSKGCIHSIDVTGSTAIAAPRDQSRPLVEGLDYSTMAVEWLPPGVPNSPTISYTVRRKDVPFNQPPPPVETGTRFPGIGYYRFPPDTIPQGVTFTGIQFEFKTQQSTGMILFAASEGQQEFLLIQLSGGSPYLIFDPAGTCPTLVETINDEGLQYFDDRWHTMEIHRTETKSTIRIDGWEAEETAPCSPARVIAPNTGVYIGGLPDDFYSRQNLDRNPDFGQVQKVNFKGCIRNFKILTQYSPEETWKDLDWSTAEFRVGDVMPAWEGCPVEGVLESPSVLLLGTGFISLSVQQIETAAFHHIWFEIKTEYTNGLLFFALGEYSHFLAQLQEGNLYVEYLSAGSQRSLTFPNSTLTLCDGEWHSVQIDVPRDELSITVDGTAMPINDANSVGDLPLWYFDIELMLGGIQPASKSAAYINDNLHGRLQESYGGCLRNLDVAGQEASIGATSRVNIVGEEQIVVLAMESVYLDGCPVLTESAATCRSPASKVVYEGTAESTHDNDVLAFTEYLYQVEAENDVGSTTSLWSSGRTREGPPTGVSPPYSLTVMSGRVIEAKWNHPTGNTGLLTSYILRGYNLDFPALPAAETVYNDTVNTLEGQITDAIPNSNYSMVFVACTEGGCTESEPALFIPKTWQAPPDMVQPPSALAIGGSYLYLAWEPPTRPNGILTGYVLYQQAREIYRGNRRTYNVTGLNVFTGYQFHVDACTKEGCSSSPDVVIITAEIPPGPVTVTRVETRGSDAIFVRWNQPSVLNGLLERYLIYVSNVSLDDLGEAAYNTTELFVTATLTGLAPDTTYFLRVGACTRGGCSLSEPQTATTLESAPAAVPDPVVVSPNPYQLNVSWGEPTSPNGVIVQYKLYVNETLMYTDPSIRLYDLTGLEPNILYIFRVEACTIRGCTSSQDVPARTQEDAPEGVMSLSTQVPSGDPRMILVKWNGVAVPNGVLHYDVYFEGLFYVDPGNWDYTVVTDRRSLLRTQKSDIWFEISGLVPISTYQIQVNASNTVGFILSSIKTHVVAEGPPDGVRPPNLTSPTARSVRATWTNVGRANSRTQPVFQLQFLDNGPAGAQIVNLFQPTTGTTYLKENLQPITQYEFRLNASNPAGYTITPWVSITTMQDRPSGVPPPEITDVTSTWAYLLWYPPRLTNGILTEYKIYVNNAFRENVGVDGPREKVIRDLMPATRYVFKIAACTIAGCTISPESVPAVTSEAAPQNLSVPTLVSETPTSVLIAWEEPLFPNGRILEYAILRRETDGEGDGVVTQVATLPDTQRQYLDQATVLSPYRTYEYQITATTRQGTGSSPWASVTTMSSGPGGVRSPVVDVVNATSLLIRWEPPISVNGPLQQYIIKMPVPQFEITNTSQLSLQVDHLTPYTNYHISLIACTDGGCTESVSSAVTTLATMPMGQQPPVGTPQSRTYISLVWYPPLFPNGPNITYELLRNKVRQPLEPAAQGFGLWDSIHMTTETSHEDHGLTIYTTYQYKVTVYNSFGQLTSAPSSEVTTYGGTPSVGINAYARPINHTAVKVWWDIPSVMELQGGLVSVLVNISIDEKTTSLEFNGDLTYVEVGSLKPNTTYNIQVTLVTHGGAIVTSPPTFTTTLYGAPEGLEPPIPVVIDDTTIRVIWRAPAQANGDVTSYYIYLDGNLIDTDMSSPGSYILNNLRPYTIYTLQMEVCTVYGCVRSEEISATTAEVLPEGMHGPSLEVQGPHTIRITWSQPSEPNGIILRYSLLRKSHLRCSEITPTVEFVDNDHCRYFECDSNEFFCGSQCYSGPMTCCSGVLHLVKPGYECCNDVYLPRRIQPSDICCGGQFQTLLTNHQCCAGRYVEVRAGQICCPDSEEDRVDVGYGDGCCGSIPYTVSGLQVCCNDVLYDGFEHQCCGGKLVDVMLQCCSDDESGVAYETIPGYYCCGRQYVASNTTACCTATTGQSQVHVYASHVDMENANEKCCGTERISNGLNCCNSVGFNPITQICADVSEHMSGCGIGVVCPSYVSSGAYCDRCDFDRQTRKCGSTMVAETGENEQPLPDYCWTPPLLIYTTETELEYIDVDLLPYTEYEYAISVENGAGSSTGPYTSVSTSPTTPELVLPPVAVTDDTNVDRITLTWLPPEVPNGEIVQYVLQRDGIEIFRSPNALQYTDVNVIQAYMTYTYVLSACTIEGCTNSQPVSVATLQAAPEGVQAPTVNVLGATVIELQWALPSMPNGFLTQLYIYQISPAPRAWLFATSSSSFIVTGLTPYTTYEFVYGACTDPGCTNSTSVITQTDMAAPINLRPPELIVISNSALELLWAPPQISNGIITTYHLYRSRAFRSFNLLDGVSGDKRKYTDAQVTAGAAYSYILEAVNAGGAVNSSQASVVIPLQTPTDIPPVEVIDIQARLFRLSWTMTDGMTRDGIDDFSVHVNRDMTGEVFIYAAGMSTSVTTDGLVPYTTYNMRLRACLANSTNSCGSGPASQATTKQDAPTGLVAPSLHALGPKSVEITWKPPENPNGEIRGYLLHRRMSGDNTSGLLIYEGTNSETSTVDQASVLLAYTLYEYRVTATHAIVAVTSDWAQVRTLEAPPFDQPAPKVSRSGAYGFTAFWEPPSVTNGILLYYRLYYRPVSLDPTFSVSERSVTIPGYTRSAEISGLVPYMEYQVQVASGNSAGEARSNWVTVMTAQAAPSQLGLLMIETLGDGTSVILRWESPGRPNGIITTYFIYEERKINAIFQGLGQMFVYRRLQPYTEYSVQLAACTIAGCVRTSMQKFRTAAVAPANLPPPVLSGATATQVTISWTKPLDPNGEILVYQVLRAAESLRRHKRDADSLVVYETSASSSDEYTFTDTSLQPFTRYTYQIMTVNTAGSTLSPVESIETGQAAPTSIAAPLVTNVFTDYDKLRIRWSEPQQPNGIVNMYTLQRNGTLSWRFSPSDPKEYIDKGLTAFTAYAYTITACTVGGCTTSDHTVAMTPQSTPYYVNAPSLQATSPTTIQATWLPPQITNGEIKEYRLKVNDVVRYIGTELSYTVYNLIPYQLYTVVLSACTYGGCTDSIAVNGRPSEAPPLGMQAPVLQITGSTSIRITWQPPDFPNGFITSYEVRRDGVLVDSTGTLIFDDYGVRPGTEYTYTVTAFNSQGMVESYSSSTSTYSTAPSGMLPPLLEAMGPTSVRASWSPPLVPNGEVLNYTLFAESVIVYSGLGLSTVVDGLTYWTSYSFRIQACTSSGCALSQAAETRTLEATPLGLNAPEMLALQGASGEHSGIEVRWTPPRQPNGVIIKYELYRRAGTMDILAAAGTRRLVYSGQDLTYQDRGHDLLPYSAYDYQVLAYNSAGPTASLWQRIYTMPDIPEGVPPPLVTNVTTTTVTLELMAPQTPNGQIQEFIIYLDGVVAAEERSALVVLGEATPLLPSTSYEVTVEACTRVGCAASSPVDVTTLGQPPSGLFPPTLGNITATSIDVTWTKPLWPNGQIVEYELSVRTSCPRTYPDWEDLVDIPCIEVAWEVRARDLTLYASVDDLQPYTSYEFRLQAANDVGWAIEQASTIGHTSPAPPQYNEESPPTLTPSGNLISVNWETSFFVNGEVIEFILFKDDAVEFSGYKTSHSVFRESQYLVYEFRVQLITDQGHVQTPTIVFDPADPDNPVIYTTTEVVTKAMETPDTGELPFYQEVWFIVLIAMLALLILFVSVACCLRSMGHRVPYIRERRPLQPRMIKSSLPRGYYVDPYTGSLISTDLGVYPPSMLSNPAEPRPAARREHGNPTAYSRMSPPSQRASLADPYKWDGEDLSSDLPDHRPSQPALRRQAYGDGYGVSGERPISVLKEHTTFTDTHL